jgi:putative ABC transport system permease protein
MNPEAHTMQPVFSNSWPLRPILSTLARHKIAAALIVLEVALTCAILCNVVFLIVQRIERMDLQTGLAESELVVLRISARGPGGNRDAQTQQDLQALRALPGVRAASVFTQLPFGQQSMFSGISLTPKQTSPNVSASNYELDEAGLATLGLKLVAGRDFSAADIISRAVLNKTENVQMPVALVTRALAERLFPGADALGQTIYIFAEAPTRIIGVVDHLVQPQPKGLASDGLAMILPVRSDFNNGSYVLRTAPERRAATIEAAIKTLTQLDSTRLVINRSTLQDQRESFFKTDRNMALLLAGVCAVLLLVTAFGIVGLASFWVQQRHRMIGIRRALGATRGQIVGYFQLENLLLSGLGIVLGMLGAFAINALLMAHYALPRLPALYLPMGALVLALLGQAAVWWPAQRAAAVPPVVVMRGV